jgi:hypothetical protein
VFFVWIACVTPSGPASETGPSTALQRVPLPDGEVWRGEVGIAFARDVLGDEVVELCLTELGDVYDSCAMRLHDCLTVVVTSPNDATVVLDARGCGNKSPENTWLIVDKEGQAATKMVGPE